MIDELNEALQVYHGKWHALAEGRNDKAFFRALQPVALGWKVADPTQYDRWRLELHEKSDLVTENWMNGRWIAKFVLREGMDIGGIRIIKIMQRRPHSDDALGIDHLDFVCPSMERAEPVLRAEPDLKWSWENNDIIDGYDWLSIWFDGTEAKVKADTVLDIVSRELQEISKQLRPQA